MSNKYFFGKYIEESFDHENIALACDPTYYSKLYIKNL